VRQFRGHGLTSDESPPGRPKVAFLFLTMTELAWPTLWNRFFEGADEDLYSIYVHRAAVKDNATDKPPLPLAKFGARAVPWVQTAWCALFGVEVASLAAALEDTRNRQFVFVSDSTLPLKNFGYVYHQLAELSPHTSKFCLASHATQTAAGAEIIKQESKRACVFRDFLHQYNPRAMKHHQWAVFNRDHASAVVRRAEQALDVYEAAWLQAAPDIKSMGEGCSDEAVPLIAMLDDMEASGGSTGNTWSDLTRMGVEQQCLTYVRWRNCFTGTSLALSSTSGDLKTLWENRGSLWEAIPGMDGSVEFDFLKSPLKRELNGFPHAFEDVELAYLETMVNEGFMFARKFETSATVIMPAGSTAFGVQAERVRVPLSDLLPALWAGVNATHSQASVWSRLESAGRPGPLAFAKP